MTSVDRGTHLVHQLSSSQEKIVFRVRAKKALHNVAVTCRRRFAACTSGSRPDQFFKIPRKSAEFSLAVHSGFVRKSGCENRVLRTSNGGPPEELFDARLVT